MSKPEKRLLDMASGGLSGFVLDPAQCSRLSLGERRELVREIARWTKDAPEVLSSFTRRELLEIICAEMGKERKYSGYTKFQMIEHLLKVVSKKTKRSNNDNIIAFRPAKTKTGFKRQRKNELQIQPSTDLNLGSQKNHKEEHCQTEVCKNASCRATLCPSDVFCKRCSCCICHYYDDNKDPGLWLTCSSDSLIEKSCGLTCHLICALKDERTGIMKAGCGTKLDGSFYCVSCGKINGLMRTWRKQLVVAKEARRVDVLCLRVLLGYRILTRTDQYREMQKIMETALQLLKKELGPLDLVCAKMARGIVNRLCCGAEVQKLCASALEVFDSMFSEHYPDYTEKKQAASFQIQLEEYPPRLQSVKDIKKNKNGQSVKDINKNKNEGIHSLAPSMEVVSLISQSFSPSTPCKSNGIQEIAGVSCKKKNDESPYEYSVRVIKWLENEGHIDEDFRVKFLTWFSLKATMQERRVVYVFVDTLIDDPPSLVGQLIHTFMDDICHEQKPLPLQGFCTSLWH